MAKTLKTLKCLNGTALKVLAMVLMLMDHMWATGLTEGEWLTCAGRAAFPLFAFLMAEGYVHTSDFKRYLGRVFLFALISEIPFNLMTGGWWLNPFHQNVMFTFCIALVVLRLTDKAWEGSLWRGVLTAAFCAAAGYVLGFVTFVDYYGYGVLTVLVFWLARKVRWGWLVQLAALGYMNLKLMGGLSYILEFGEREILVPQQAFALLALIPIWLYNGKRGPGGKKWKWFGYVFYPAHILILALLMLGGISL